MMSRFQSVPTHSKEILNDPVNMKESLSLVGRFKASHLPLLLSRWLMRYLGSIVRVSVRVMSDPGHDFSMCHTVASQLVGHETKRFVSLTL